VVSPAQACHRFSVWKYPFPQRCAVARVQAAPEDRSWFVEIQDTAVVSARTPEQDADQIDHDAAVASHKDEINDLMKVLKLNERSAGYQGVDDK
jgi:hypothetical protein